MNYSWNICSLDTRDEINNDGSTLENAVVSITWQKIATNTDGVTSAYLGKTELSASEVSVDSFVSFSNLTEEAVLGWVQNSLSQSKMDAIDATLLRKMQRSASVKRNPPWVN